MPLLKKNGVKSELSKKTESEENDAEESDEENSDKNEKKEKDGFVADTELNNVSADFLQLNPEHLWKRNYLSALLKKNTPPPELV